MVDKTNIPVHAQVGAHIRAEFAAIEAGDLVRDDTSPTGFTLNADRPSARDRIEQATQRELDAYLESQAVTKRIFDQLYSRSVQSAVKSIQVSKREFDSIRDMVVSTLPALRTNPARSAQQSQPKIEQRPSGIAVVKHSGDIIDHIDRLPYSERREIYKYLERTLTGKRKPGPEPMTDEEKIEIVTSFRKTGLTQQAYIDLHFVSKYSLQTALSWYRAKFESA